MIVGACLIFLLTVNVAGAIPLAIFLLLGIYIAVRKPYKKNYHNYRAIANMSISVLVEGIYLAYTMINPN